MPCCCFELLLRKCSHSALSSLLWPAADTNGDGRVTLEEFEQNLRPKTRAKIEERLNMGWKFDHEKWATSLARHAKWDMSKGAVCLRCGHPSAGAAKKNSSRISPEPARLASLCQARHAILRCSASHEPLLTSFL